jgi:hypothetical protein
MPLSIFYKDIKCFVVLSNSLRCLPEKGVLAINDRILYFDETIYEGKYVPTPAIGITLLR